VRKVIGVITARMSSTRLPGKVLKKIAGKTNFCHHVERLKCVKGLDGIFLATSKDPHNKALIEEAEKLGCGWHTGAEQDVVERHVSLCERERADAVVRVTCDCPLFDIESTSQFVELFKGEHYDFIYVSNLPMLYGTLAELISYKALIKEHQYYKGPAVSIYIRENMSLFKTLGIELENDLCRPEYRLTVDEPADLTLIRNIYKALYRGAPLSLNDVYAWLDDNPTIAQINKNIGVKGINIQAANLMETPLYSLIRSGKKYVILDQQKKPVESLHFVKRLSTLFPELKGTYIK
jgi:spore coat polysaccharide biosynthesis protein SpsF